MKKWLVLLLCLSLTIGINSLVFSQPEDEEEPEEEPVQARPNPLDSKIKGSQIMTPGDGQEGDPTPWWRQSGGAAEMEDIERTDSQDPNAYSGASPVNDDGQHGDLLFNDPFDRERPDNIETERQMLESESMRGGCGAP